MGKRSAEIDVKLLLFAIQKTETFENLLARRFTGVTLTSITTTKVRIIIIIILILSLIEQRHEFEFRLERKFSNFPHHLIALIK